MPKRRKVPSLQSLSISSVGSMVVDVNSRIDLNEEPQRVDSELQKSIGCLRELLYLHVPFNLYDKVAVELLETVSRLIGETTRAMNKSQKKNPNSSPPLHLENANMIACCLPMIVLTSKLSTIDCRPYSPFINSKYILSHNLHRLTGLKTLNLGEFLFQKTNKTLRFQEWVRNMGGSRNDYSKDYLQKCIAGMKHLESLYILDINEHTIPYLLQCQNLKQLNLDFSLISTLGIAKLIAGLPKLQEIGRCEEFEGVMKHLHQQYSHCGPFGLRKVITKDMSRENLQLCARLFPKLEEVYLEIVNSGIADLTVLTLLDQLNSIRLISYAFYSHQMKQLLEAKGGNITCLDLTKIYEINPDALINLSQYCPKLTILEFRCCYFQRDRPISSYNLKVQPFQCLEKLVWVNRSNRWKSTLMEGWQYIEFILIHAVNIRYITVDFLTHSSIVNILAVNPMKQLEVLKHINDANMRTVELLLEKCENIKVLGTRGWWENFPDEYKDFMEYIKENNLDLFVDD